MEPTPPPQLPSLPSPPPPTPKQRPPYLLGLLCLIPLVGAFVGLGLLLYGLLRYKDKWLSIIGAFGIVWTVLVYSVIFQAIMRREAATAGFKSIAAEDLNGLVAHIELYKLQRGHYPDSLGELRSMNKFVPIVDPVQGARMRGNSRFNYGRVGDKYYLFSSGPDGIPNTADDFYPSIDIPDSSKIGLIRPV